jgi:hypothetical protein
MTHETNDPFNEKPDPNAGQHPIPDLSWYPDAYPGKHLSAAQIDGLLHGDAGQGEADEAVAQHLHRCPLCAAELAELRGSIGLLRTAATEFAVRSTAARHEGIRLAKPVPARATRNLRWMPATLALAASLAVAAGLAPVSSLVRAHFSAIKAAAPRAVGRTPEHSVADDDALLREIDQQLSTSVPTALEPLADPAANDTTTPNPTKKD